jgi:hypothetical protein
LSSFLTTLEITGAIEADGYTTPSRMRPEDFFTFIACEHPKESPRPTTEFVAECTDSSAQPVLVQRASSDHTETTIKNTFLLKKSILHLWRAWAVPS